MNPEEIPPHEFLFNESGLTTAAKELPNIREGLENLPDRSATYKLKHITDVHWNNFDDIHLEFLKSWPVPERYSGQTKTYVNPHYIHKHRYTDIFAECECGAVFTHNYERGYNALEDEHSHNETCTVYHRLEARASIHRKRHESLNHLVWLGWKGVDVGDRWGVNKDGVGYLVKDYSESITSLRESFKIAAAKTYSTLVHEKGASAKEVAEVYGYTPSTLGRWINEFGIETDESTFTRAESGLYKWKPKRPNAAVDGR